MRKSVTLWSAILLLGLALLGGCRPAGGEIHLLAWSIAAGMVCGSSAPVARRNGHLIIPTSP